MMRAIISRFAPAPTGFLHVGHVVNAIYVWGVTRRRGGRVLLRIEDHDRQRSRSEFDAALLEDLAWLGFAADGEPVRQSDRGAVYGRALEPLVARGLVYACTCSRAQIAGLYPGTCRGRRTGSIDDALRANRNGAGLRVRLDPAIERFHDLRHGWLEQEPWRQCGDLLVRDRDAQWTYQFAATVDDYVQGVTLVIRGDDLLDSTGRQLQLARLIGRETPPEFLHHPLIMKSPSQKLSKSDRDTGVRDLKARGWTPESVIGHAAALAGLISAARDVRADEVSSIISL